jgi:anhydro-N-acetylmuramic acid kinase
MSKIIKSIGLMSGTSLDGIDLSMIESDGLSFIKTHKNQYYQYSDEFKNKLRKLIFDEKISLFEIKKIENELTILHANLVNDFLEKNQISSTEISVIGFHGQTIFHKPIDKITWQIGNAQLLAHLTKINVVADFRVNDIVNGGQGAPLVPIYHYYLFANQEKPIAILNIGGVSNITYFNNDLNSLIAFDLCFGNAPMNDLMMKKLNREFDRNGEIASQGKPNIELIESISQNKIFHQEIPRSFSRNDFDETLSPILSLELPDALATLSLLFAKILANNLQKFFNELPKKIIVCGGGAKNKTLLKNMQNFLPNIEIIVADEIGFNPDFIESEAFAFLAVRRVKNLPISFKNTTKVNKIDGIIGGVIYEI